LGIFSKDKAPVDETIYVSSAGILGIGVGSLPVAIIIFLALIF
jgi:hypothetical protein